MTKHSIKATPGFRAMLKEANSMDKMPSKRVRKWKRKDRQAARKEIRREQARPI